MVRNYKVEFQNSVSSDDLRDIGVYGDRDDDVVSTFWNDSRAVELNNKRRSMQPQVAGGTSKVR